MYYSSSPCCQECLNCWRPAVLLRREEPALWGHFSLLPSTEQRPSTRGSYPADESSIHHEGPCKTQSRERQVPGTTPTPGVPPSSPTRLRSEAGLGEAAP